MMLIGIWKFWIRSFVRPDLVRKALLSWQKKGQLEEKKFKVQAEQASCQLTF